jgi:hypothetical protein
MNWGLNFSQFYTLNHWQLIFVIIQLILSIAYKL